MTKTHTPAHIAQLILIVISVMILTTIPTTADQNTPANAPTNEIRDWAEFFDESLNDLQEEKAIAAEDGKKGLLIMFEMDECPFCKRMKNTILNQSKVQDYYRKHFRILMIDVEGDLELTDFEGNITTQKDFSLKQHRVRATPVFQFFDLKGNTIKNGRLTGAAKNAEEFLLLGKYIIEGENEKIPFFKYKRAQGAQGSIPSTQVN